MVPTTPRARVQVNFGGKRYTGLVHLPPGVERVSDLLNDGRHFLCLEEARLAGDNQVIPSIALNKHAITHVQALEEELPPNPALIITGHFVDVEVRMASPFPVIHGQVFLPDGVRGPGDALNDHRDFLSLRHATIAGTAEAYPYLAIGKAQVVAIAVPAGHIPAPV
ncbi:MAG: hypothetical protein HZA24_05750 [Nitrospirae bacterium]|nr:hypothetical protein [Nitrospirota bacterium]